MKTLTDNSFIFEIIMQILENHAIINDKHLTIIKKWLEEGKKQISLNPSIISLKMISSFLTELMSEGIVSDKKTIFKFLKYQIEIANLENKGGEE